MRNAWLASLGVHALLLAALVVQWQLTPAAPAEVEGKIEVLFGKNALTDGAPPPPQPADAPAATAASVTASATPAAEAADPPPTPASTASGAAAAVQPPSPPVRLGEGKVGFDVPQLDSGMVEAQADPGNRPPIFPDDAAARREHGKTVLGIHIDVQGRVSRTDLLQSAGYPDLDRAAQEAVRRWRFIPQLRDGQAVPSYREQAFDFLM